MKATPDDSFSADQPHIFLMQEKVYCSAVPAVITTILGSCIAVTLWDRTRGYGGMNHFVLPRRPSGSAPQLRYGDTAVDRLVDDMADLGCRPPDLEAKLFGGAAVLATGSAADSIGAKNVAVALDQLRRRAIAMVGGTTGGSLGLQIRMATRTGEVLVRRLKSGVLP